MVFNPTDAELKREAERSLEFHLARRGFGMTGDGETYQIWKCLGKGDCADHDHECVRSRQTLDDVVEFVRCMSD